MQRQNLPSFLVMLLYLGPKGANHPKAGSNAPMDNRRPPSKSFTLTQEDVGISRSII